MNQHLDSISEDSHTRHRLDEVHDNRKGVSGRLFALEVADALLSMKYRSRSLRLVSGV